LEIELRYLQKVAARIGAAVAHLPRVVWVRSYDEFLVALLGPARIDPDVGYFPPLHLEHALSRYFFSATSDHRDEIDAELVKVTAEDGDAFTDRIVRTCRALTPRAFAGSIHDESKCLLVLYRALFNRCYELNPEFFAGHRTGSALLEKVDRLRHLPSGLRAFCLPWELLPPGERAMPIRELFESEPSYKSAADALSMSALEPNPIDQLYQIHRVFLTLQDTANRYRHRSDCQVFPELLSFDELFALFFGVVMAADFADVFFVRWMINEFAPKSWLSPSFEYAVANLDALVIHLEQLDVGSLEASMNRDR
jgi:hypothetical protein